MSASPPSPLFFPLSLSTTVALISLHLDLIVHYHWEDRGIETGSNSIEGADIYIGIAWLNHLRNRGCSYTMEVDWVIRPPDVV